MGVDCICRHFRHPNHGRQSRAEQSTGAQNIFLQNLVPEISKQAIRGGAINARNNQRAGNQPAVLQNLLPEVSR